MLARAQARAVRTVRRMTHNITHQHTTCPGCDHIHDIDELVVVLRRPKDTLYKASRLGPGKFPRRLRDRAAIAVRCRDAKAYLGQVSA
jgi:hypothetical protein